MLLLRLVLFVDFDADVNASIAAAIGVIVVGASDGDAAIFADDFVVVNGVILFVAADASDAIVAATIVVRCCCCC